MVERLYFIAEVLHAICRIKGPNYPKPDKAGISFTTVEYSFWVMTMNKLRAVMFFKKVNQEMLSELTGIDQSELSKIINNKRLGMQLKTAQIIAQALDSTVEEIWPYGWWLGK